MSKRLILLASRRSAQRLAPSTAAASAGEWVLDSGGGSLDLCDDIGRSNAYIHRLNWKPPRRPKKESERGADGRFMVQASQAMGEAPKKALQSSIPQFEREGSDYGLKSRSQTFDEDINEAPGAHFCES